MDLRSSFFIGHRKIGDTAPAFIIAEGGVNHFGDLGKAFSLVELAADAGADAFKTQVFSTDRLISRTEPVWRARLRSKEIDFSFLKAVRDRCREKRILFLCTAHDDSVIEWLDELEVPAFKIGSGERRNLPYLREIGKRGKPVVLSTGMHTVVDVDLAVETLSKEGCEEVALLHCVTSYPTPYDQVNLRAIGALRDRFGCPVGYSDHTDGHHAVLAAVALGASIVEKHISLDFDVPNAQDWKVSAGPDDFSDLVRKIRDVEAALGTPMKELQPCERGALHWALKSIVAAYDLAVGTIITREMIVAKRPGGGLSADNMDAIIGRELRSAVKMDEPIKWEHLKKDPKDT